MGIEFNPNVNKTTATGGIEKTDIIKNPKQNAIINVEVNSAGMGIGVEENEQIKNLLKLFADVPAKPEFNIKQENLVIKGALMAGAFEETAEV